ncbi:glycyl-radical enzyme activating protein [Photobacterium sp. SDRW27]|uniref:glycyl-radical enzyme activating protein n=1 Tax=Photobacterium obscurum TaxID=2829490 RepID=UPI002243B4C3|nr:glycyl-radical enzyme activating protein [Photobacterium obscurum]MCW8329201.1 glycyl-radical enzyme activating protein [Photobacterium obscurum]
MLYPELKNNATASPLNIVVPETKGVIINIQRFSVHDGPGIRTVVFLKGCSLRCLWCSNPESIKKRPQVGIYSNRCIGTDKCDACLKASLRCTLKTNREHKVISLKGIPLGEQLEMANACPSDALKVWGKIVTVSEVLQEVLKDRQFYKESGGGLTLSGGEALLQHKFATDILKAAHSLGINTCVETALHYPTATLDKALPYIDLALCDLKHMHADKHKMFIGASNQLILDNLKRIAQSDTPIVIRIPVVPEHNGTKENLRETAQFIKQELKGSVKQVQLLPFRKLGEDKYQALQIPYPMASFSPPARKVWEQTLRNFAQQMCELGVPAVAGTGNQISNEQQPGAIP